MSISKKKIRFVQGTKSNYDSTTYEDAIYFATDSKELYLNGNVYGKNSSIQQVGSLSETSLWFLQHADAVIAGETPNLISFKTNSGEGYAFASYKDALNFRIDAYTPYDVLSPSTVTEVGTLNHYFAIYKDGQPDTTFGMTWIPVQGYDMFPMRSGNNIEHVAGWKEYWLDSTDGEIKKHYWDGSKFQEIVLPTSKDIETTYTTVYQLSFTRTPTLTFSTSTKVYNDQTMYRAVLAGAYTQMYCDERWIVKGDNLISYSDGTRYVCFCNQDGGQLSVGSQICIQCDGDCIDMDLTSSCFSHAFTDGVHILTVTTDPQGDAFIAIKRYMYMSAIMYRTPGSTKTFTVSTPSGVQPITVVSDVSGFATKDELNTVSNTLNAKFPVTADNIADSSITRAKLAFDIDDSTSVKWFNGTVDSSVISTAFPTTATAVLRQDIRYDTTNNRFVSEATFTNGSQTVGSGTYLINNGMLVTSFTQVTSKYSVPDTAPQSTIPAMNTLYASTPGLLETYDPDLYYYNGKTLVKITKAGGSSEIVDGSVTTVKLADNSVTTAKIANTSVTTEKIADGAITGDKIATDAVTSDSIAADEVMSVHLQDNAVITSKIKDGNVTADKLAANAVTTGKIADNSITEAKIAGSAITTAKIKDGSITADKLASDAITEDKISFDYHDIRWINGTVADATMSTTIPSNATRIVQENILYDTTNKCFVASVSFSNGTTTVGSGIYYIVNGCVATSKTAVIVGGISLSDTAPQSSTPELGVLYVSTPAALTTGESKLYYWNGSTLVEITTSSGGGSSEITDGSVTTAKLADNAVSTAKIAYGAVTSDRLAANSIVEGKLAPSSVTTLAIADKQIYAKHLAFDYHCVRYFHKVSTSSITLASSFPTGSTHAFSTTIWFDSVNKIFVAHSYFRNDESMSSIGSGYYKIKDGLLVTSGGSSSSDLYIDQGYGLVDNSTPAEQVLYIAITQRKETDSGANALGYCWDDPHQLLKPVGSTIADNSITTAMIKDNAINSSKLTSQSVYKKHLDYRIGIVNFFDELSNVADTPSVADSFPEDAASISSIRVIYYSYGIPNNREGCFLAAVRFADSSGNLIGDGDSYYAIHEWLLKGYDSSGSYVNSDWTIPVSYPRESWPYEQQLYALFDVTNQKYKLYYCYDKNAHGGALYHPRYVMCEVGTVDANSITTAKLADSSVTTAKLADKSVTKDKVTFDVGTTDVYWFNDIVDSATISTTIPSTATVIMQCTINYDTANKRFVADVSFGNGTTTVGSGTYLINNGKIATSTITSTFSTPTGYVDNSTPKISVIYTLVPGLTSTSAPALYYYTYTGLKMLLGSTFTNLNASTLTVGTDSTAGQLLLTDGSGNSYTFSLSALITAGLVTKTS